MIPLAVREVRPEGEGAVSLAFDAPEGWTFEPGQYLTIRRPGTAARRSYSIACAPGEGLRIGVRRVPGGEVSGWAQGLGPGDVVEAMAPDGRFTWRGERDVLLVAAGSGITPMVSIASAVLGAGGRATLVYGNRGLSTVMFRDALGALKDRHLGRFRVVHVMSREAQDMPMLNGRVDGAKLRELAGAGLIDPSADAAFVCGPGGMIDDAGAALRGMGMPEGRIRAERFTQAGEAPRPPSREARAAAEGGVAVEVVLDGARRAFEMRGGTVLEAAEAAGLDLPWSCRGGMCCTCRCRVREGASEMAVNFSLEPWEVEAGYTLACQTRPVGGKLVLDFDAA